MAVPSIRPIAGGGAAQDMAGPVLMAETDSDQARVETRESRRSAAAGTEAGRGTAGAGGPCRVDRAPVADGGHF